MSTSRRATDLSNASSAPSFDSLDIMEKVMRHFYLRALIEELAEHESPLISRASPR
jgi:hypothetical protein